jgi:hypothetical protein
VTTATPTKSTHQPRACCNPSSVLDGLDLTGLTQYPSGMTSYTLAMKAFESTLTRLKLPELSDPAEQERLGRRAALLATSEIVWDKHLGPMYGWSDVAEILGTVRTRQGVSDLAKRKRLLALPASGGRVLYPAFQFHGSRTIPGLHDVLVEFDTVITPWTIASWFQSHQDELGGESPVSYLTEHGFDTQVRSVVRRATARLAS